jgi:Ca2+-binding EF-hand superfamily protein
MISRRTVSISLAALSGLSVLPAWAAPRSVMFDTDNDGTVDLAEAKKAASALFDRLDRRKDGTLHRRELRGRLNPP